MSLNSGLQEGQRWGCGSSFREAVPLGDVAGKVCCEYSLLGPVEGYVKGTGVGLAAICFWFPDVGVCFELIFSKADVFSSCVKELSHVASHCPFFQVKCDGQNIA